MSRWVIVDDTDPAITYTGPWFPDQGTLNSLGYFGPPYLGTLHGSKSNASFSYSFSGTKVIIFGTNQFTNSSGVTNPSWQCIIDGITMPSATVTAPENRQQFCGEDGLSDGPHVITVKATVSNQQTFWFDYIQYLPSPSMSLAPVSLAIYGWDPQLQYGTGWSPIYLGNMTEQTGSNFSFEFNGISLIWLGFYLDNLSTASTTATYAIDGQSPIIFSLNGTSSEGPGVQYNQVFFQTDQLPYRSHNLDVVYNGNSSTTPLTLSALLVQYNISSPTFPTGSSSGTSSAISGTSTDGTSNVSFSGPRHLGPIIGGVIGGLALLTFAISGILFLRRRNKRSQEANIIVQPFASPPTPLPSSLPLAPNCGLSPSHMTKVSNATPLLTGLREHRKGEELINRAPQLPQDTRAADLSSSSMISGNNFQPTGLVRDEGAGIQLFQTNQDGYLAEPPPVYSS